MDSIIIYCAKYALLLVVIGVIIAWFRVVRSERLKFAAMVVSAGIVALALSRIASRLYYDPRPFVTEHVKPLIAHAADNGFPSDHALFTMTLTAVTYFFSRKIAAAMLAVTVVVGLARVLAKIHSPLDIGAAWLLGIAGAVAAYYAISWWLGRASRVRK